MRVAAFARIMAGKLGAASAAHERGTPAIGEVRL